MNFMQPTKNVAFPRSSLRPTFLSWRTGTLQGRRFFAVEEEISTALTGTDLKEKWSV